MIAPAAVEAAIADAAVALDVDYDAPNQVTTERVEHFRDLVRAVRQQMRADLGIDQ